MPYDAIYREAAPEHPMDAFDLLQRVALARQPLDDRGSRARAKRHVPDALGPLGREVLEDLPGRNGPSAPTRIREE